MPKMTFDQDPRKESPNQGSSENKPQLGGSPLLQRTQSPIFRADVQRPLESAGVARVSIPVRAPAAPGKGSKPSDTRDDLTPKAPRSAAAPCGPSAGSSVKSGGAAASQRAPAKRSAKVIATATAGGMEGRPEASTARSLAGMLSAGTLSVGMPAAGARAPDWFVQLLGRELRPEAGRALPVLRLSAGASAQLKYDTGAKARCDCKKK